MEKLFHYTDKIKLKYTEVEMSFASDFSKYCKRSRLVGAQVAVVSGDNYQLDLAYGSASLEAGSKVKLDTIFRIASISKIVVAMAALQLIEKNLISLDDDIGDILGFTIRNPRFPNNKITIRMLMTQTTGITDGYDENRAPDNRAGYDGINATNLPVTLKELLVPHSGKYYSDLTWSDAAPGSRFIYSNFGCGILACIIEAVSNIYFTDYVRQNIFFPLGIDASFRADEIKNKEAISNLYHATDEGLHLARSGESFIKAVYPRFPLKENYRGPAGGLFINMHDLSKIVRILINDGVVDGIRILKKATVDLMHQIHWFGQSKSYKAKGLQLKFIDFSRRTLKGHTGSAYGAVSYLFVNREEKLGICFVTNGGYYRRAKQMLDIMENTLNSFLKHYWPIRKKKYCLTADLQTMWGCLNDRIIVFDNPILKDDDIYLTVKNIADIFDIVPITTDSQVILKFGRRQLATTSEVLSLKAVCAKFRVKFHFKDNHLKVVY